MKPSCFGSCPMLDGFFQVMGMCQVCAHNTPCTELTKKSNVRRLDGLGPMIKVKVRWETYVRRWVYVAALTEDDNPMIGTYIQQGSDYTFQGHVQVEDLYHPELSIIIKDRKVLCQEGKNER